MYKDKDFNRLDEQNRMTQFIIDSVIDGIILIDELGIIKVFNPSAEKIFGYLANEILGKNIKILMSEPFQYAHDGYLQHYQQTGEQKIIGTTRREITGLRKDGSIFPMDLAISDGTEGTTRLFTGIVRDITPQKKAVLEAKENQKWFRHTQNINHDILAIPLDSLSFNSMLKRILELILSASSFPAQTQAAILLRSEENNALEVAAQLGLSEEFISVCSKTPSSDCLCEKTINSCEVTFTNHSDDLQPKLQCSVKSPHGRYCVPIVEGDRNLGALIILMDEKHCSSLMKKNYLLSISTSISSTITRKIAEEKNKKLNSELNAYLDALDEHAIVSATDVKGNITHVNDKFVAISGYSRAELIGQNHRMIKSDEHSIEFYQVMWKTILTGNPFNGEVKNLKKNGEIYWVRATIVPFLNEEGKPFKFISIRTDITDNKMMEKKLNIAKETAEDASRAKSDFLANMSHEIRTPMNAVIGLSHLCLQTRLTARQKDYIEKVYNSATSLLRIINDILDFSKIEAGKLDIESSCFTMEEVLGSMSTIVSQKAQEKKLEFVMETAVDIPPSLIGDSLRLGQILINLTNNAIKFTEKGEINVITELLEQDEEHALLQFTVKDTGIGMTAKQKDNLFQSFSQADSSITRKYGGTGLGLTISKLLIEMMDGEIWVETGAGVGSKFIFTARLGVSKRGMERLLLPTMDMRGKRVLVVDDNESARNVIAGYLSSFTFRVSKAIDGKDAIVAIQEAQMTEDPFDLVIMDYMMPELDGITATAMIRNDLQLTKQPVVIMATAYGQQDVIRRANQEAGVNGFLVKPINQSLLFESIMEAYGHAGKGDSENLSCYAGGANFQTVLSGARILLVEDNKINQQVAKELLEQANITVLVAENGKQGVEMVCNETLDGVLMDIQMPVMDGLTATREIRKNPLFTNLPIIAMTANAMSTDKIKCLEAGMQDHIAKPIDPATMFTVLTRWIKPASPQPLPADHNNKDLAERNDDEILLPDIAGINVQAGLKRIGGNISSYLKLLVQYKNNQGGAGASIHAAIIAGDSPSAELLAHTLKGVSGTIGAEVLQEKAKRLEDAIKESADSETTLRLLSDATTELNSICNIIEQTLPKEKVKSESHSSSGENEEDILKRNNLLKKMAAQLSMFDSEVENTLDTLQQSHISKEVATWLDKVEKKVSQYDYDSAFNILKECAYLLNVDLEN